MENHEVHGREEELIIRENIAEHGYFIALFEADGYLPSMAYTIGLYETFNHPELIIFGLEINDMGEILNEMVSAIKSGKKFEKNYVEAGIIEGYDVHISAVNVINYSHYLGYMKWYYTDSTDVPVLQLIWPDRMAKWPWDESFNEDLKGLQPLPDQAAHYRFLEDKNLAVFTTKQVLEGRPILVVIHNDNGDWQFHCEGEQRVEDAVLVGLEELAIMDPSINEVFFLNYGETASRSIKGGEWMLGTENHEEYFDVE